MGEDRLKIEARIIADSLNSAAKSRCITYVLTYPRFIHAEVMTHRMFSRNAASSRAIPIDKVLKEVDNNPVHPSEFGTIQKGMQAGPPLEGAEAEEALQWFLYPRTATFEAISNLQRLRTHKQVANRLLEPWMWMTTIVTATEWANFFNLRASDLAQPEFEELSYQMLEAYVNNKPRVLTPFRDWHIPFGDKYMEAGLSLEQQIKIGVARCARVSYKTFEGDIDYERDYTLHDKLLTDKHMSPFEHVARCLDSDKRSGNLVGFEQYRKTLKNENQSEFDPVKLLEERRAKRAKRESQ